MNCKTQGDACVRIIEAYFKAKEANNNTNELLEFECPICHNTAKGRTESSMGHIRVACNTCGMSIIS